MKLKDFLKEISHEHLSDYEKFALYEKILSQTSPQPSLFSRIPIKQISYRGILVFLLFGIYGTYFFNTRTIDPADTLFVNQTSNTAQAQYIAKIVEFTGDFHIQKKHGDTSSIVKTSMISNHDEVFLKDGTTMSFDVIDGSKIIMVGPARFSISKEENSPYRLYLHEGNWTSVQKTKATEQAMEVIVNKQIIIKPSEHTTHFQIAQKGKEYFVNNKGASLHISNPEKQDKILETDKVLTINTTNDISNIQDKKQFATAITTKDISQSFDLELPLQHEELLTNNILSGDTHTLSGNVVTTGNDAENTGILSGKEQSSKKDTHHTLTDLPADMVLPDEVLEDDETVVIEDPVLDELIHDRNVFNEEQHTQLKKALNRFFVQNDIQSIYSYHLLGDTDAYHQNIQKLNKKFIAFGNQLGLTLDPTPEIEAVKSNLILLKTHLQKQYYTPKEYFDSLDIFVQWINKIDQASFGTLSDIDLAEQQAKAIIQ